MNKAAQIISLIILATLNSYLRSEEVKKPERSPPSMIGSTLSLNVDFDIFRGDTGTKRKPEPPVYLILPAPDGSGWGKNITYLGRMIKGTIIEIVEVENNEENPEQPHYLIKPITPLRDRFKVDIFTSDENIDDKIFGLSSIPWSKVELWGEGYHPNGIRKLNDTWFTIIKLNE